MENRYHRSCNKVPVMKIELISSLNVIIIAGYLEVRVSSTIPEEPELSKS